MADGERVLKGKVIDTRGGAVGNADVWLFRQGGSSARTTSRDDGTFELEIGDAATWPAGAYRLRVLPPGIALDTESSLNLPEDGSPAPVVVDVATGNDVGLWWGRGFLVLLCALLVAASWLYLELHGVTLEKLRQRQPIGDERIGALSEPLADALRLAQEQAAGDGEVPDGVDDGAPAGAGADGDDAEGSAATDGGAAAGGAEGNDGQGDDGGEEAGGADDGNGDGATADGDGAGGDDPDDAAGGDDGSGATPVRRPGVTSALATAEKIFGQVKRAQVGVLDESEALLIDELFKEAKAALAAGDGARLESALAALVEQVEDRRSSFLWDENPGRLIEVMFWALLATLLRLIFNTGDYLYKGTFLKTAIPHHLSFLFITPVVAVIIALVLTVVRVDPALDGTGVLLDMSSVLVSIILAALIGLAPWHAWGFLCKLADRVFERLAGLLRSDGDGDGAGGGGGQGAAA